MIRFWSDTWNGYAKRGYRNDEPVSSVAAFHNSMTRDSLMCHMSESGQVETFAGGAAHVRSWG